MKTMQNTRGSFLGVLISILFMITTTAFSQKEIVRETRDLPAFNQIDAGGAFQFILVPGTPQKVEVEARQKDIGKIATEVKDNKLSVTGKGISNNPVLNVYITMPSLTRLEAHGAADVESEGTFKEEMMSLEVSGAASVDLSLDVKTLSSDVSGAADLELAGKAERHSTVVSGAGTLNAFDLKTVTTDAEVSGAGTAKVSAGELTGESSGAGKIYSDDGNWAGNDTKSIVEVDDDGDTTYIKVPGTSVIISEGDDSVKVKVGNRVIIIDDDGNVKTRHHKWPKFNGHWAGVDIGLNGFVTPDFNMNLPREYEYLDLRMEKSIAVNLNFFEQNIPLSKNQKWGIVTGLGLGFNDYRFLRPTRLSVDSSFLVGYIDKGIEIRKSKLSAMYLTLPVLFEFQTAPVYHNNGFHINVGVVVGARLSSHTKKYYEDLNAEFDVTQYNPATGMYETVFTAISPEQHKTRVYDDYFLQPFKFDATARIGWNFLNFWASYSLNSMFREGKGPELYPWGAGITLVCF